MADKRPVFVDQQMFEEDLADAGRAGKLVAMSARRRIADRLGCRGVREGEAEVPTANGRWP